MKVTPDGTVLQRLMVERNLDTTRLSSVAQVDYKTVARALRGEPLNIKSICAIRAALKATPVDDSPDIIAMGLVGAPTPDA